MNYEEKYTELVDRILVILQCDRSITGSGARLLERLCVERNYKLDDHLDIISCNTCNDYIDWAILEGDNCHPCGETWKYNAFED